MLFKKISPLVNEPFKKNMTNQKICWLCDKFISEQDKVTIESAVVWLKNAIKSRISKVKEFMPVANNKIYNEKIVHCSCVNKIDKELKKICGDNA